ncbi:MAG: hypothetical protein HY822_08985, partial [Acidobacteria bacterium]|nr:hypothetical protein [Acidobacteriota bacterium]
MAYRCLLPVLLICASAAHAALTCVSSAVPTLVNAEGLAERMGDILLTCTGGAPGQTVTGNLTLFQSVNVTNRTDEAGRTDVQLAIDNGSPLAVPPIFATALSSFSVAFNGLSFNLSPAGAATVRITNLRGAVARQTIGDPRPITVSVAFNGPLAISTATLSVGMPTRGLLASSSSANIYCVGSPAPTAAGLSGLFAAGTSFHSTRVTEGWAEAFQKGTRIMARYTGLPAGARLFAPDYAAGSNAAQATAGGDLGPGRSGGQYTGGSDALLLTLVRLGDSDGAGGILAGALPVPGQSVAFDSVSEVPLRDGSAVVVYEVLASSAAQQESAQFPVFLVYTPPRDGGDTATARQTVSLAPLSNVAVGNASAPVPRFAYSPPPNDCSALRDCDASYFPRLFVDSPPLNFTAPAG